MSMESTAYGHRYTLFCWCDHSWYEVVIFTKFKNGSCWFWIWGNRISNLKQFNSGFWSIPLFWICCRQIHKSQLLKFYCLVTATMATKTPTNQTIRSLFRHSMMRLQFISLLIQNADCNALNVQNPKYSDLSIFYRWVRWIRKRQSIWSFHLFYCWCAKDANAKAFGCFIYFMVVGVQPAYAEASRHTIHFWCILLWLCTHYRTWWQAVFSRCYFALSVHEMEKQNAFSLCL